MFMQMHDIFEAQKPPSLQSAIRHNGKVYSGGDTHLDVLRNMPPEIRRDAMSDGNNRGYITHLGRFVDRERAAHYARKYDLFRDDAPDWVKNAREFASEYLHQYQRPISL